MKNKVAALIIPDWEFNFDVDNLLKIDYSNIFGEIITIPVLTNQVGRLVSELSNYVKIQELNLKVKEAEVRKIFRNKCSKEGRKAPSIQETEDYLTLDPIICNMRYALLRYKKDLEDILWE